MNIPLPAGIVKPECLHTEMLPWWPGYYVSYDGTVLGRRGRELSPQDNGQGYIAVSLQSSVRVKRPGYSSPQKLQMVYVHRLVCWYFNGPYPDDDEKYEAAHLDCNPGNNWWWNLEWQTHTVNMQHPITRARHSAIVLNSGRQL